MKKSIASVCLSGDLRQKFDAVSRAGFTGVEIFENDLMLFDEAPGVVKQMAKDYGLTIIALQPLRDFEAMPAEIMKKNFDRAERKFDLMAELGTDTMLICSNVSQRCINTFNRAADDFSELAERAASRNIMLGYEALAWGAYIADYEEAWRLVKYVDHKHLGIILDSFHIYARSGRLDTIRGIPGDRITLIQIADAPWLDMDPLLWSRHFRCFPGQGNFPLVDFMQAIINTGYEGYISHEIFNDEFRSAPSRQTAVDGMRSLLWLEEKLIEREPDIALPDGKEKIQPLPPATLEQVEFIEFAAEGAAREELLTLLTGLGFRITHKHRSKEVDLFRLGEVNIVVNEETDSYAQHYYLLHGASVCAVAYLSKDAQGMAERADYFGYSTFETNVERGELNIPAVKGIGGELMYFIQREDGDSHFFDVDFIPDADKHQANAAFPFDLQFDHVTSSVSEGEFLSVSLMYRTFLGLNIKQPQDIVDPYGIVVSRTAESKDCKIRLPFNMSRSWGTTTERFRHMHNGSGVQHIALRCNDILAFVKTVDPGIILSIPENYYDDFEARIDLDADLLASLKQYNLLYDSNDTGHFIHFYTHCVNGVFFEVVQRHKYSNYGEVNAQVRMASQARQRISGNNDE